MTDAEATERATGLMARTRCPHCSSELHLEGPAVFLCANCGASYDCVDGIWRMLTEQQQARFAPFLESYPIQRSREGWVRDAAYYLSLPEVPREDPTSLIWRIRKRSLSTLENQVGRHFAARSGWALDLGAGNCWLSRRLTRMGFSTVALDLNVASGDSLSTGQLFIEHDKIWFDRVQASMDSLPFVNQAFDLCTVSAALYYADVATTLHEVYRVLKPDGMLVISDSPVYSEAAPGVTMAEEQRRKLSRVLGQEPADLPGGSGFLVESELVAQLEKAGFRTRVLPTGRRLGRTRRWIKALLKPQKREEAKFPIFIGVKPSG